MPVQALALNCTLKPSPVETSTAFAAVAPSSTSSSGCTRSSSARSHGWHALASPAVGVWWMRRLPRCTNLKCFTAFVTYT